MPWTIDDVDQHKKGLSNKQKARWVSIANSVLQKCMKDGGEEKTCAVSAIKQANGTIQADSYTVLVNEKLTSYVVQEKTHQERKHLVVPVVMIVEGVLNGSHGPLLHLVNEFGKIPESWNGIPVVINHPEQDGYSISANSPEIIDGQTVGRVYNTHVLNNKLVAEAWLDELKLNKISADTLSAINMGQSIEISVGVYTEDEQVEEGDWKGVKYNAIARNHRPDHLALLPDGVGACNLNDGCGIRANQKKGGNEVELESKVTDLEKEFQEMKLTMNGDKIVELIQKQLKKEITIMDENKKCTPCIEKKATELIANKATKFTEADRGWLETFEESQLDLMLPTIETIEVEKVVTNALSPEDQAALDFGKKELAKRRKDMVEGIQKNCAAGTWEESELTTMSETMLEKLYKSTVREEAPVDYSLQGNVEQPKDNNNGIKPMLVNV